MKAVEHSLSYRGGRAVLRLLGRYTADSLIGRAFAWAGRGLRPAVAASFVVGSGRVESKPLTGALIARPAFAVQRAASRGAVGRGMDGLAAAASDSVFGGGTWVRVAGAAVAGLGCGTISVRAAAGAVLIVVGLILGVAGPWLWAAAQASFLARLLGWKAADSGTVAGNSRLAWAAMAFAAAAGVFAGAGSSPKAVVAAVVFVALVAAVLRWPQLVLLAAAGFPWVDWVVRRALPGLGPLWDDALLVVSVLLVLWAVLLLRKDVPRSTPVTTPVLLMIAAAVGSIVVNQVAGDVGLYALRVLFEPILFYFVGFLLPKSRGWVRWTAGIFVATCTLLALHGMFQYLTHAAMPASWVDVTETGIGTRAFSVVQNPNVLGGILAMGALISGSLALSRAFSGMRRIAVLAACVVQLGGLAVTFSRGAWIGFVIGLIGMTVLAYRRYIPAVVAVAAVAWFAAPQVFIQRLLFSFSSAYAAKSSTGLGRVWRWESALQHIADKPLLGLGLGTFGGTAAYMFDYWGIWVDNFYLQMGAEGGLLLLVLFLWLLLRGAKGLVRGHRLAADPYLRALAAGMFGAFIAVVAADFFEADWETLSVAVPFWFLTGLVTSALLVDLPPGDANGVEAPGAGSVGAAAAGAAPDAGSSGAAR